MKGGIVAQPQVDYCLGVGLRTRHEFRVAIYTRSICTNALQVTKIY